MLRIIAVVGIGAVGAYGVGIETFSEFLPVMSVRCYGLVTSGGVLVCHVVTDWGIVTGVVRVTKYIGFSAAPIRENDKMDVKGHGALERMDTYFNEVHF